MPLGYLKQALKHFYYKTKYPTLSIAIGSHVFGESQLGAGVKIDKGCNVYGSRLGNSIEIEQNCHIANSTLENNIVVDEGCRIYNSKIDSKVMLMKNITLIDTSVESFSYVNLNGHIRSTKIGKFCSIAQDLICAPGEHPTNFLSTSPVFYMDSKNFRFTLSDCNYFSSYRQTTIGHDCWIGARVFIKGGIKVGNGAVIAAGSVVVKDVPDYAIVGGIPAKVIRFRFSEEIIKKLLEIQWWHWNEEKLREVPDLFNKEDIFPFLSWVK